MADKQKPPLAEQAAHPEPVLAGGYVLVDGQWVLLGEDEV